MKEEKEIRIRIRIEEGEKKEEEEKRETEGRRGWKEKDKKISHGYQQKKLTQKHKNE